MKTKIKPSPRKATTAPTAFNKTIYKPKGTRDAFNAAARGVAVASPFRYGCYTTISPTISRRIYPAFNHDASVTHWHRKAGIEEQFNLVEFLYEYMGGPAFRAFPTSMLNSLLHALPVSKQANTPLRLYRATKRLFHENRTATAVYKTQGRKYYLHPDVKERIKENKATVEDFLKERNHEVRRLILATSLKIEDVLGEMHMVLGGTTGDLYAIDTIEDADAFNTYSFATHHLPPLYLHVRCPSTQEHYLLQVPNLISVYERQRLNHAFKPTPPRHHDAPFAREYFEKEGKTYRETIIDPAAIVERHRLWTMGITPGPQAKVTIHAEA